MSRMVSLAPLSPAWVAGVAVLGLAYLPVCLWIAESMSSGFYVCGGGSRRGTSHTAARTLQAVAIRYSFDHSNCPSVPMLMQSGLLDEDANWTDPWDHPFRVTCAGNHVDVSSPGRDGIWSTRDDVTTRPRRGDG